MQALDAKDLVYSDESGIDHRIMKTHGWSRIGKLIKDDTYGARKGRTSVIAALCNGQIIAPFRFQGHCNKNVFFAYISEVLIPVLQKGQTLIIDNASFHKSNEIKQKIEEAGCNLLFLPPYSPDFNPIEHYWSKLKKLIRKLIPKFDNISDAIDAALITI